MQTLVTLFSRLWLAVANIRPREWARPRLIRFSEHPFVRRGHAKVVAGGRGTGVRALLVPLLRPLAVAVLVGVALGLAMHWTGADPGVIAADVALLALPDALKQKKQKHDELVKHVAKVLDEHKGRPMPQNVAEDLDQKAQEAETLWAEIEPELKRYETAMRLHDRAGRLNRLASAVPDPALPGEGKEGERPERKEKIVGYLSLGEAVVNSPEFKQFIEAGMPRQNVLILSAKRLEGGRHGGKAYLPLTKADLEEWRQKSAPSLGADVIEPQRLDELVRVTEQDQTVLRDVLNVAPTTSDSVTYVRLASYTRAAAAVAKGAAKPEAAMSLDTVTESVRTHAVWIPVHNNDLSDFPRLRNIIDTELLYDLRKLEEEQVLYGDGAGENFQGIVDHADVQAARTVTGDTLIDIIRRAITDVRRSGYAPNAVVIDPLDWEEIELSKGTDNRYVWAVIRDPLGPRIWSLRVVETVAAEANEGNPTERRNVIVGDWVRGATLWVREAAAVSVGWINDQFTKNQRTILAEQRAAFGVKRPNAFRVHQTQAAVT